MSTDPEKKSDVVISDDAVPPASLINRKSSSDDTSNDLTKTGPSEKSEALDSSVGDAELERRKRIEQRLVRKIDYRMAIMILIYMMNYIDRNAASAARLATYEEDLGLKGNDFAVIIAVYFVGYILMQVPSNMLLNHIKRPSLYIPATTFIWGVISTLTGVTKDFSQNVVCRFFLGIVEAAFFPGAMLLMSHELGFRSSALFCGLLISIAFGNLIASGILTKMHGVLGHSAWRWLFFIEGGATLLVAIIAAIVLPDFPENETRWLTEEEREIAIQRLAEDLKGDIQRPDATQMEGFKEALKDWKTWCLTLINAVVCLTVTYVLYLPTLAKTLGFNDTITLLLCAPPSFFVAITSFLNARHSDKTSERCLHIVIPYAIGAVGHLIVLATLNPIARYIGFFLIGQGPAGTVCLYAWISNSFPESHAKHGVALGIIYSISQLGAIVGSFIYPVQWEPGYRPSFGINIGASFVVMGLSLLFRRHLMKLNAKAEAEEKARGQTEPGFRYML